MIKMNKKELNKILKEHKEWLSNSNDGVMANLQDADLRYADLRNADLRYADLRNADLRNAYLEGTNLQDANLQNADLRNVDLQHANLQDANLRYADLRYANLRYADLRNVDLRNVNLRYADLQNANLDFSCFPLWCGSFGIIDDGRLIKQLLGHIARITTTDKKLAKWIKKIPKEYVNDLCNRHEIDEV